MSPQGYSRTPPEKADKGAAEGEAAEPERESGWKPDSQVHRISSAAINGVAVPICARNRTPNPSKGRRRGRSRLGGAVLLLNVVRQALSQTTRAGRSSGPVPEPKAAYDVVIVGAGGHGLATAYYLARKHGVANVAVLEKGWLGGGNTGRNTTIIRSNYLWEESRPLRTCAEILGGPVGRAELQRHVFGARRDDARPQRRMTSRSFQRHVHANRLAGIDNEWLTPTRPRPLPDPQLSPRLRYPFVGAALQRRGGAARHDAVAWGYARGRLRARGGHHPELRGDRDPPRRGRRSGRRRTTRGPIAATESRRRRGRTQLGRHGDGRGAHAARQLPASGAGLGAGQADDALRRDVEHDPRLHVAVRQGRDW